MIQRLYMDQIQCSGRAGFLVRPKGLRRHGAPVFFKGQPVYEDAAGMQFIMTDRA